MLTKVLNNFPPFLGNRGIDPKVVRIFQENLAKQKPKRNVSAIFRVKNCESSLLPSFFSLAPLLHEVVFVDNLSTDKTMQVIENLEAVCKQIGIKCVISEYNTPIARHGIGYSQEIKDRPEASIAKYYNYAFSLASSEYLMKADANLIYFPKAIARFSHLIDNKRPLVRYRGCEIFGKTMAYEPSIVHETLFDGFIDSEKYEVIKLRDRLQKYNPRNFYLHPAFLHYRRIFDFKDILCQ